MISKKHSRFKKAVSEKGGKERPKRRGGDSGLKGKGK